MTDFSETGMLLKYRFTYGCFQAKLVCYKNARYMLLLKRNGCRPSTGTHFHVVRAGNV